MTVRQLLQAFAQALPPDQHMDMPADARGLDTECTGVTHDSRRVGPGFVYVALRGLKADGADFAPAAIAAGAAAVIVERRADGAVPRDWVTVTDARLALALLSAEFSGHPSRQLSVVGVTGTNGKTTTAYLINAIFAAAGTKSGLMGTVAYRIGDRELTATRTTPEAPELQGLMRQMVDAGCRACVMEVSSHALALRRADGIRFAAGVFTNLTRDHLDFHDGMEDYFAAKRRLFELLPADAPALINADDPRAAALIETAGRPMTYGINKPADVSPGPLSYSMSGLEFDVRTPQGAVHVRSRLVGKPNVYNILAAVGTAAALGVPLDAIERGLALLPGVPGRFEVVSGPEDDVVVVVDYAHTDDALRNLLETARPLASRGLATVFGAGGDRDRTKRPLMGMVAARMSDAVVITSDNPRGEDPLRIIEEVRRGAEPEVRTRNAVVHAIADRREAIHFAIDQAAAGDVVLIAGKGHEKYQEVAGEVHPFDDVTVARDALDARRVRSRVR
ncbi:MAG: UDP-N-acetylmuramoyl-L-alanyl-D-glutamate--2,6-diaminopimelate ligase [Vicinamibacterales bacterium]